MFEHHGKQNVPPIIKRNRLKISRCQIKLKVLCMTLLICPVIRTLTKSAHTDAVNPARV